MVPVGPGLSGGKQPRRVVYTGTNVANRRVPPNSDSRENRAVGGNENRQSNNNTEDHLIRSGSTAELGRYVNRIVAC